jgi:hypothetical protein
VDRYVRERLCSLRQLQEDLATSLSQVTIWMLLKWFSCSTTNVYDFVNSVYKLSDFYEVVYANLEDDCQKHI